jgi:hypothetical protein
MRRSPWSTLEALVVGGLVVWMFCVAMTVRCDGSELDEYTRKDRLQHAGAGLAIGLGTRLLIDEMGAGKLPPWQKALITLAPVVLVAALKEASDSRHPERHDCDPRDFYATVIGGTVAITLTFRF